MHGSHDDTTPGAAQDTLDLGILGALGHGVRALSEIVALVQCMAGPGWRPESGAISRRLVELAGDGLIERRNRSNVFPSLWFALTAQGRIRLDALIRRPAASGCRGVRRAQLAMKACLLDELPESERHAQLDALIAVHESELMELSGALACCPAEWSYLRRSLEQGLAKVRAELDALERLRHDAGGRPAAAPAASAGRLH